MKKWFNAPVTWGQVIKMSGVGAVLGIGLAAAAKIVSDRMFKEMENKSASEENDEEVITVE